MSPMPAMLRGMRSLLSVLFLPMLLALGCERKEVEVYRADQGEAPEASEDPLGARLHALGATHAPGYTPEEVGPFRGELRRGEVEDHSVVFRGARCYVAFGVGGDGVENLDITIVNANGAGFMRDGTDDDEPIVGLRHSVCPEVAGSYRVRVRMARGDGAYAVKLYGRDAM